MGHGWLLNNDYNFLAMTICFYFRIKTSVPVFYRGNKYGYEFGGVWIKSRVRTWKSNIILLPW